jgi:type IV secretion system protein VirD4
MTFRPFASVCRVLLLLAFGLAGLACIALAVRSPILAVVPVSVAAYRRYRRYQGTGDAFGTARDSGFADLTANGQIGGDCGLIIGNAGYIERPSKATGFAALVNPSLPADLAVRLFFAAFGSRLAGDCIIRVRDGVHGAIFAPSGAGKGVGFLIPNALAYDDNCVFNDPQASIFNASAAHRQRKFGHRIVRYDAFNVVGPGGDSLNSLEFLPPASDPACLDACRDLANMMVVRQGTEHDPHWNDSAERVLTTFIYFIVACEDDPARRNLISVRKLIASRERYLATLNSMKTMAPLVQEQGATLSWLSDKELNSVMSVTQRHTAWMDSPAVSAFLSSSSFDPRELKGGRITVYNILPPKMLVTMAPLSRVIFGTILRTLSDGPADERHKVQFFIDEAAHLGRVNALEDAVTLMRGYGIRLFFAYQSVNQLTKVYGDYAQTILDNLNTQLYCGVTSYEGTEQLSKLIGDRTIQTTSLNDSRSHSNPVGSPGAPPTPGNSSTSVAVTISEQARRWVTPDEIRRSPSDLIWLFHKNQPVTLVKMMKYFNASEFRRGGTGKNRSIGLAGAVLTAVAVLACLMVSDVSFSAISPRSLLPTGLAATIGWPASPPLPVGSNAVSRSGVGGQASSPRPAYYHLPTIHGRRRRYDPRLPSQSGFLIRIPDPPRRAGKEAPPVPLARRGKETPWQTHLARPTTP